MSLYQLSLADLWKFYWLKKPPWLTVSVKAWSLLCVSQCSKMHSKHLWHNTMIISLEYHFKLPCYYFGIKSNLRLSCPSKNFRFQIFLVIIWHMSWHFVLFLNSKHCFHWYWNTFVTQPFISCQVSWESALSLLLFCWSQPLFFWGKRFKFNFILFKRTA